MQEGGKDVSSEAFAILRKYEEEVGEADPNECAEALRNLLVLVQGCDPIRKPAEVEGPKVEVEAALSSKEKVVFYNNLGLVLAEVMGKTHTGAAALMKALNESVRLGHDDDDDNDDGDKRSFDRRVVGLIRYNLGLWHLRKGDHENAFLFFKEALETSSDDLSTLLRLRLRLRLIQSAVGSRFGGRKSESENKEPVDELNMLQISSSCFSVRNRSRMIEVTDKAKAEAEAEAKDQDQTKLLAYLSIYGSYFLLQTKALDRLVEETSAWLADLKKENGKGKAKDAAAAAAAMYYISAYLAEAILIRQQQQKEKGIEDEDEDEDEDEVGDNHIHKHTERDEWAHIQMAKDVLSNCIAKLEEEEEEDRTTLQHDHQRMMGVLHVNLAHLQAKQHQYVYAEQTARKAHEHLSSVPQDQGQGQGQLFPDIQSDSLLSLAYCQCMAGNTDSAIHTLNNHFTWCSF